MYFCLRRKPQPEYKHFELPVLLSNENDMQIKILSVHECLWLRYTNVPDNGSIFNRTHAQAATTPNMSANTPAQFRPVICARCGA